MESYIPLKTSDDVAKIRESCRIAARALRLIGRYIQPGITTYGLDRIANEFVRKHRACPGAVNKFPGSICTSVNHVAVHGIPSEYKLREGDLITVDISVLYEGWYGDAAWSYTVGKENMENMEKLRLLDAAKAAVSEGIKEVKAGSRIGNIGAAVEKAAAAHGCYVLEECVGHGIGIDLHEEPEIPHIGLHGEGLRIVPGMVLTVEPVISTGQGTLETGSDGWSLATSDKAPTAQFEHTLAVFKNYTEVLTDIQDRMADMLDF